MILYREIKYNDKKMVIICDKDLYGKKFEEEGKILEINEFFKGREISELEDISSASVIFAVGEKSISILLNKKVIDEDDLKNVKKIQNVPYLFIIMI